MNCPLCNTTITWEGNPWRPFCSEHCQLMDLGQWASERYRIAGPSLSVEAEVQESDPPQED